jgi:uncharacterized protein (TIGR02147 family)
VDVFSFLDARQYLRAYYEAEKKRRSSFSYRYLSMKAGFRSPNFFKLVIDGQRNLGVDAVPKVSLALGHNAAEGEFFADLVSFTQARSVAEKNRAFARISATRRCRSARRLEGEVFSYFSHWYSPAIRELTARNDFREDPKWIANTLRPKISVQEAKQSLALLLSLGLVVRDQETGRVVQGDPTLTTEHEVTSLAVKNFHRQMLERASESIDTVKASRRDLAALTACVSEKTAAVIKDRIHRFREEIAELCDQDEEPELIYQLNLQLFPLSASDEESPS